MFKSPEAKPVPFMREEYVSEALFAFIQHQVASQLLFVDSVVGLISHLYCVYRLCFLD